MNITKENIDTLNAVLKVKIEKSDYEEKVSEVLKDYRKKAQIPGFRPGKVPFGMVKKMYGTAVMLEEVNKLISESVSKYIFDEKLKILGDPLPNEEKQEKIDWETQSEFEFVFDLGLVPEFEFKLSKRDKVPYYNIKVEDKFINDTIENHTRRYGKTEDVDAVEENELLKGTLVQLDKDGNPMEDGILKEDAMLSLEVMKDDDIKKKFKGVKANEEVVFELAKAYPSEVELASLLGIDKEVAKELSGDFKLTITTITKYVPSEINQELFDQVYGKDAVKSEEEFKAKIVEEIQSGFSKESDYKLSIDVKNKFVEKTKMDLPEEFLKRWLKYSNKEIKDEEIEKDFANFADGLKWTLIKENLIQENEIKIEEEEILELSKEMTLAQFRQYGLNTIPDEQLEQYAKEILKKEDERKRLAEKLFEDKVVNYIKENIKLDEKDVTTEEFNKLFEK
jgi:trigger factor